MRGMSYEQAQRLWDRRIKSNGYKSLAKDGYSRTMQLVKRTDPNGENPRFHVRLHGNTIIEIHPNHYVVASEYDSISTRIRQTQVTGRGSPATAPRISSSTSGSMGSRCLPGCAFTPPAMSSPEDIKDDYKVVPAAEAKARYSRFWKRLRDAIRVRWAVGEFSPPGRFQFYGNLQCMDFCDVEMALETGVSLDTDTVMKLFCIHMLLDFDEACSMVRQAIAPYFYRAIDGYTTVCVSNQPKGVTK